MPNPPEPDQVFTPNERLYRRFKPEFADELEVDVIDLPNISVNREKYSKSPGDVLRSSDGRFDDWGVCVFRVKDVPERMGYEGIRFYEFRVSHEPTAKTPAHSEVQAFLEGKQIADDYAVENMDPGVHLRFRQKILDNTRVEIAPGKWNPEL